MLETLKQITHQMTGPDWMIAGVLIATALLAMFDHPRHKLEKKTPEYQPWRKWD